MSHLTDATGHAAEDVSPGRTPAQSHAIERIKIYGERNTGTRYLHTLCEWNFTVPTLSEILPDRVELRKMIREIRPHLKKMGGDGRLVMQIAMNRFYDLANEERMGELLGWKHMSPPIRFLQSKPEVTASTLFIAIVKHPVFWTRSFHRNPYHDFCGGKSLEFSQFLRHAFIPTAKDNVNATFYPSIVDLYASKVDGYRELAGIAPAFELVRYEELIADAASFIKNIEERHRLNLPHARPITSRRSANGDERGLTDFQAMYSLDKAKSAVSNEDYAFIIGRFGVERLNWLGYPH